MHLIRFTAAAYLLMTHVAWGVDVFDEHTADILKQVVEGHEGSTSINHTMAMRLKPLSRDIESACLVISTKSGNLAKVLASWGFRKSKNSEKPVPVVMLDRFVTYEKGRGDSTVANGRNVMLFPGFQFDFDLGQVVPTGFDADLEMTADGMLKVVTTARIHGINGSQLPQADPANQSEKPKLNPDAAVIPDDFTGSWKVDADGRWKGTWNLLASEDGSIQGKFHSEESEASYPISGQIGPLPHQVRFQVTFNNTTQMVDAFMWTKDKTVIAGSFTMTGRKFGVYATRMIKK